MRRKLVCGFVVALGVSFSFLLNGKVCAQELYSANLHVHSYYSYESASSADHIGCPTPSGNVADASDPGHPIKVLGFSDHGGALGSSEWADLGGVANANSDSSGVIALRGFEWTGPDHINVFGTADYTDASIFGSGDPAQPLKTHFASTGIGDTGGFADWLKSVGTVYGYPPVAQFNHIGTYNHFGGFPGWDEKIDKIMCLAEIGAGEVGAYSHPDLAEPYYRTALQAGWHVAPSIGIDSQEQLGDQAATRHTGIWVDSGSGRAGVMDALRAHRVFASEDIDISFRFRVKTNSDGVWHWMGETIWADPNGVLLYVDASDPSGATKDQYASVDLMSSASSTPYYSWGTVDSTTLACSLSRTSQNLNASSKTSRDEVCFYVRMKQKGLAGAEQDYIYSAPIWIRYYTLVNQNITEDTIWTVDSSPYLVRGQITVAAGATLTIQPGTVVKFQNSSSSLVISGHLVAQGTSPTPIQFTSYKDDSVGGDSNGDGGSSQPSRGDWQRILVNNASATALIDHCVLSYGGSSVASPFAILACSAGAMTITNSTVTQSKNYGVWYSGVSGVDITDSTISNSGSSGIYLDSCLAPNVSRCTIGGNSSYGMMLSNCPSPTLNDSTFNGNGNWAAYMSGSTGNLTFSGNGGTGNGGNGLYMTSCTVDSDSRWHVTNGFPYVINARLTVNAGKTLTLDPGTIIKFNSVDSQMLVTGVLSAEGTASAPIYFTSVKDDAIGGDTDNAASSPAKGDWNHILIAGSGARGTLNYCVARYGGYIYSGSGYYDPYAILACNSSGAMTISNSTITQSKNYGVYAETPRQLVKNSIIAMNGSYGVYMNTTSSKMVYCDLWSNGSGNYFGAFAVMTGTIEADPLFVNSSVGDYHLQRNSPCIDSGDPTMRDADGTRVDMGAFPYVAESPSANVAYSKLRADESVVTISGAVVTAGTDIFGWFFYIEDPDRTSGIKVYTDSTIPTGVDVEVTGRIFTDAGERALEAYLVWAGDLVTIPSPFFLNNTTLGGGDWRYDVATGVGQSGITGGFGLNNIGLLVKTSGKFTYVDSHTFTIDDGSGVNVKCIVPDSVALDEAWTYVTVTGISSCEKISGEVHRLLRVRAQTDITAF